MNGNLKNKFREEYFKSLKDQDLELNGQVFVSIEKDLYIEWLENKIKDNNYDSNNKLI